MGAKIKLKDARGQQDNAAGGNAKRKMYTEDGVIVTVSLELDKRIIGHSVSLRFKNGKGYKKLVGVTMAEDRLSALKEGWSLARRSTILRENRWRWLVD
jgi:hypothetical protein